MTTLPINRGSRATLFNAAGLLSLLIVSSAVLAARIVKLEPGEVSENQRVFWAGGTPFVLSDVVDAQGYGSRIIISPASADYRRRQRVSFYLNVINYTPDTLEVSYDDIVVNNSVGEQLEVVTGEMRRDEIRDDAARAQFAQALAASLQAYGQTYSALAAGESQLVVNRAQRENRAALQARQNAITRSAETSLDLTVLYFGRTTVFPTETYTSFVDIHPPNRRGRTDKMILSLQVGNDNHRIEFNYVEVD